MQVSRTNYADQAVHLSDLIGLKFASQRYGFTPRRMVRVVEPDGPSTDGGRKARQSIVLMAESGDAKGAIVCGWLDVFRRVAELKNFASVSQAYRERYGVDIDLPKAEYQRMLESLLEFLRGVQIDARVPVTPRGRSVIEKTPAATVIPTPPSHREKIALAAGGVLFGFALCYLLVVLGAVPA